VESRSKNREDLAVFSHSRFLRDYPGADGVKSGYTKQARKCYVGSATRNGWWLVSAVLGSCDANMDTAVMMDYGFGGFDLKDVVRAGEKCADAQIGGGWHSTVSAVAERDLRVAVPKSGGSVTTKLDMLQPRAPILKGTKVGTLKALLDGREVASVQLLAGEDVGISFLRWAWIVTKWCALILMCLIGGLYGTAIAKNTRRRRRRLTTPVRMYPRGR
jgi:D-alanyl-D-alanine carboxypeptidase (penicillin-binding protein 5/6)